MIEWFSIHAELLLMFQLMDRVRGGVDPMIANLESYIVTTGLDDMKASADTITSVSYYGLFSQTNIINNKYTQCTLGWKVGLVGPFFFTFLTFLFLKIFVQSRLNNNHRYIIIFESGDLLHVDLPDCESRYLK